MTDVIDKALIAHAFIKKRLCEAINDPASASSDEVRSDQTCAFGLWIYGPEGIRQSWRPEVLALRDVHARFHEAAYQALLATQQGRLSDAQESISSGSFEICSQKMKQALIALKATRL